nr:reverse transcriptase domain-containing protein [Tanacetum cinerariifolium]
MADNRTMAELLRAPTEGYAEAIVVPPILAEQFELKHSLINMMITDQFFGLEKDNPHDHIRCKPIASQVKACDVNSNSEIAKLTHALNQQTSNVTTAMTSMLKQFQATKLLRKFVLLAEVLIRITSVSPPVTTLSHNSGIISKDTFQQPQLITIRVDERAEETFTDPDLAEYTIKVPPSPTKKYKPPSQREFVVHKRDPLHPNILYPSRMLKQKQQEKDEVQILKFWQMFKQLHINITLVDALILMPKYQKMLKALLSNKEKLQELANTPLNENCLAVILKKLPEKLRDPGKFLIPCGFNELKCKALADLGASINLMPLSIWKKLGLPKLIPTRMTLELANRAICTPARIARDVFVLVGKFTFPAVFVIVDYEIDPRVPLILRRPFLQTARALIDVHDEEMILRDSDERLTLNMRHDTPSYSNQPQRESINLINIFNVSSEDFLKGCNILSEKLPGLNYTKDLYPPPHDNPLIGSTTYFSNSLLEEFADELPSEYDDNLQFDIESDLKEIEFLLYQDKDYSLKDSIDQKGLVNLDAIFVDPIPEMFTDEHTLDYSSPPIFDVYDDDFLEVEVDALPSTNNEDKVFNPGILIQEKLVKIITRVIQDKKLAISNAFLVLEDFDPPFYVPLFLKEVPKSTMLLPFSFENEKKIQNRDIHF